MINIDTLAAFRELQSAGFSGEQADALIHIVRQGADNVATKQDIAITNQTIEKLEIKFDSKFNLVYWMLGFNLAATTAILLKMLS